MCSFFSSNLIMLFFSFFFFSSRRRHTRSDRDWSSDVCSSDLESRKARKTSRSLPGMNSPVSNEPKTTISSSSPCDENNFSAKSSMAWRTRTLSTDFMTTEFNDCLRVVDGHLGFVPSIKIRRRAAFKTIRIPRRDVVFVQLLRLLDQNERSGRFRRQTGEQITEHVSPCIEIEVLENRLDGFLRGLMRGERRPLVITIVSRVASVTQVRFCL